MRPGALLMLALLGAAPATAQQHAEHVHARPAPATSAQHPAAPPIAAVNAMNAMAAMGMHDDARYGKVMIDRLEWTRAPAASGQAWEAHAWYGGDFDRLLLRSEGEREQGRLQDGDAELLWSHALAAFWDGVLGVRHDLGPGPRRDWLAIGIAGLAPYWFEFEATAYVGTQQRTAARLRAAYEIAFSQRLILQPEMEVNLYGRADRARLRGSGLADASAGLRLRYEIRREIAPYIGVVWQRAFGATATLMGQAGETPRQRQWVAGLRLWF